MLNDGLLDQCMFGFRFGAPIHHCLMRCLAAVPSAAVALLLPAQSSKIVNFHLLWISCYLKCQVHVSHSFMQQKDVNEPSSLTSHICIGKFLFLLVSFDLDGLWPKTET